MAGEGRSTPKNQWRTVDGAQGPEVPGTLKRQALPRVAQVPLVTEAVTSKESFWPLLSPKSGYMEENSFTI